MATAGDRATLYETVAEALAEQIHGGCFRPGEKIPGTRLLADTFGVSINTILQAQKLLENWNLIEAVPRSGFYVKASSPPVLAQALSHSQTLMKPALVRHQRLALELIQASGMPALQQLGTALPHESFLPLVALERIAARVARSGEHGFASYEVPPGLPSLREALAQRMVGLGCRVAADDILITNGCHEALSLALRCVTAADDVVLVESPTYYGLFQVLDALGLRALTIPCHPHTGISLKEIRKACEQWPVKACILLSSFGAPLVSCPQDEHKQALLQLLAEFSVPLVEDDIFGDLSFDGKRPPPYKKFDDRGEVLYCSSFSKSVAPGLRVGWLAAGRYVEKANYLKFAQNIATPKLTQMVLAEYLRHGSVDKQIRKVRRIYAANIAQVIELIERLFPAGTQTSQPQGGFILWVKLPEHFDTAQLFQQALIKNIFIAPGKLFSSDRRFRSFLRINCAQPWVTVLQPALTTLSQFLAGTNVG
ncbi:PLP-dependent aminotransferase family protein [Halioxenophilus sp. WMMB6]|uniref:aminotransferase-like domain-containing protein n=1 Tax=Halioxenophilus sp. WMMB6 TaxID=3073815 RepID=UPI00295E382F|nr:PLP-dependent aminotransferase family protein [Halioxenophilus sp. WMMB6]